MESPALSTTNPSGTPQDAAGVLGAAGTTVLFGGTDLSDGGRSGGRFTLGMWLDSCETVAISVDYTGFEEERDRFSASSDDFSILARPFFNAEIGSEDSRLVTFPGQLEGTLSIEATSEFQTGEILLRRFESCSDCWRREILLGYRFSELEDGVRVRDSSLALSGPTAGATLDIFDTFATKNRFHGGQLGVHAIRSKHPHWSFEFLAKVALGNTQFRGSVFGQTTSTSATGDTNTVPAGLLAQDTNIGTFEDDSFSAVAELGVSLRHQLRCGLSATLGYTFLLWSDVLRAAEQIDDNVNLTQVPPGTLIGPARPGFPFDTTSFWAQGLNVGFAYDF